MHKICRKDSEMSSSSHIDNPSIKIFSLRKTFFFFGQPDTEAVITGKRYEEKERRRSVSNEKGKGKEKND